MNIPNDAGNYDLTGGLNQVMECIQCHNCKIGEMTYYCVAKNDFVIEPTKAVVLEKVRDGWKKGDPRYEVHRRKLRKDSEG